MPVWIMLEFYLKTDNDYNVKQKERKKERKKERMKSAFTVWIELLDKTNYFNNTESTKFLR